MLSDLRMVVVGAERVGGVRGGGPVTGGHGGDEERVAWGAMVTEEHEQCQGQSTRDTAAVVASKDGEGRPSRSRDSSHSLLSLLLQTLLAHPHMFINQLYG
jgi:hypothetical protein